MKRLFAIVLIFVLVPCAYGETLYYNFGTYVGDVEGGEANGYGTFSRTVNKHERVRQMVAVSFLIGKSDRRCVD